MSDNTSFQQLMTRLRGGDQDAAARVFHKFANRLIGLARGRLRSSVRRKVDPEDVVQSAYRSFFGRYAKGDFLVDGWDGLWGLLAMITARKCGRRVEYFLAARRSVAREQSKAPADNSAGEWHPPDNEPTPAEAAMLAETIEQLMQGLDQRDREIVSLSLQGFTPAEIGSRIVGTRGTNPTERTVQRVLKRVREHLQRGIAADE